MSLRPTLPRSLVKSAHGSLNPPDLIWDDAGGAGGRPLSALLSVFDTKLKGLWIPSGIKSSISTQWDDATTTAAHITLSGSPTNTTIGGQAALAFDGGGTQFGQCTKNFTNLVATNALTFMAVLTQEGAGGANDTGSGTTYNNKSAFGDSGGWVNLLPFFTGAVDKIQQCFVSATTAFEQDDQASGNHTPARSAPIFVETWYSASTLHMRVNANAEETTATGPATFGGRTGFLRFGVGFAAYLNCKISMALICNASRTAAESTAARAIIASAYGQPTWAT